MNAMAVKLHEVQSSVDTERIRALQSRYPREHAACRNWGLWSGDRRGIFPGDIRRPSIWNQFKRSEMDEYGEIEPRTNVLPLKDSERRKPEPPERQPYDEKLALRLDERIHGHGGLPEYVRIALRTAYVTVEVPEHQFPALSGCGPNGIDAFCERLESAFMFVRKFA